MYSVQSYSLWSDKFQSEKTVRLRHLNSDLSVFTRPGLIKIVSLEPRDAFMEFQLLSPYTITILCSVSQAWSVFGS